LDQDARQAARLPPLRRIGGHEWEIGIKWHHVTGLC
jgi:hypothetical protein